MRKAFLILKIFWEEKAKSFFWHKKWNKVLSWNFNKPEIKWFEKEES